MLWQLPVLLRFTTSTAEKVRTVASDYEGWLVTDGYGADNSYDKHQHF
ncbi:MAG: hypothetical protein V7L02_22845 [Nostoc sp.]